MQGLASRAARGGMHRIRGRRAPGRRQTSPHQSLRPAVCGKRRATASRSVASTSSSRSCGSNRLSMRSERRQKRHSPSYSSATLMRSRSFQERARAFGPDTQERVDRREVRDERFVALRRRRVHELLKRDVDSGLLEEFGIEVLLRGLSAIIAGRSERFAHLRVTGRYDPRRCRARSSAAASAGGRAHQRANACWRSRSRAGWSIPSRRGAEIARARCDVAQKHMQGRARGGACAPRRARIDLNLTQRGIRMRQLDR